MIDLTNLRAALRELFRPDPWDPPEVPQSVDEQTRVRTAFIRKAAHPAGCDGTDNCGCAP